MRIPTPYLTLLILGILLLSSGNTFAQNLVRKGQLGVQLYAQRPSDTLPDEPGLWVQAIVPGSTAETIGLKPLDRIRSINGTPTPTLPDLLQAAGKLRSGEPVQVSFTRGTDTLTRNGTVVGKPLETIEHVHILYDEFQYRDGYVRCILKTPADQPAKGLIYFLPGIFCISLDNLPKDNPYFRIQEAFLRAGYQLYIVEKAGMGDSRNEVPCAESGFADEVDLYRHGFRNLFRYASVQPAQVFLFGHSLGGIIAPVLANEFRVKGIIVYGTVTTPWKDYILNAHYDQSLLTGVKKKEADALMRQLRPLTDSLFEHPEILPEVQQDSAVVALLENIGYDRATGLFAAGRTLQFHREIDTVDLEALWKQVNSRVLSLYGGADLPAYPGRDMKRIAYLVNETHPGQAEYRYVRKTEHGFQVAGRMKQYLRRMDAPEFHTIMKQHFNYRLMDDIIRWCDDL